MRAGNAQWMIYVGWMLGRGTGIGGWGYDSDGAVSADVHSDWGRVYVL